MKKSEAVTHNDMGIIIKLPNGNVHQVIPPKEHKQLIFSLLKHEDGRMKIMEEILNGVTLDKPTHQTQ